MLIRLIVVIILQDIQISNQLYCTLETNVMLYVTYISIKKKSMKYFQPALEMSLDHTHY